MDDIPFNTLIYAAMVAILFLKWIFNQGKRASQRRQEIREQRMRGFDAPKSPHTVDNPQPAAEPTQTLQELFEQRRREIVEAQKQDRSPPPLPEPQQHPQPEPTREIEPEPVMQAPQKATDAFTIHSHVSSSIETLIGGTLADRQKIRQAFILKEILDKPKGLDV